MLIHKAPITIAADDILIFFIYFSKKISFDISYEPSAVSSHEMSRLIFFGLTFHQSQLQQMTF